mmetsp:Transcript_25222/g.38116  ORF Transcript_25222/g.38116 Transcript_25222/m.38116 type:complete len:165 (-) Transcript_25222:367-861(-)
MDLILKIPSQKHFLPTQKYPTQKNVQHHDSKPEPRKIAARNNDLGELNRIIKREKIKNLFFPWKEKIALETMLLSINESGIDNADIVQLFLNHGAELTHCSQNLSRCVNHDTRELYLHNGSSPLELSLFRYNAMHSNVTFLIGAVCNYDSCPVKHIVKLNINKH